MKKILKLLKNPLIILLHLDSKGFIRMNDTNKIRLEYKSVFGYYPDLNSPKTFNEKLQWLKLNNRKKIYTTMVDKYEAKEYVANIIGEEYIIPTLGIYNSFNEINFDELPNQFVIKCTHDSGGIIICNDKSRLDIALARKKIDFFLKRKYYYIHREWPYKNVKPRIIIEKYMVDDKTKELRDYKFFCFNGKVKYFKIDFNRNTKHQANYYDENGNLQYFGEEVCPPDFDKEIDLPNNLYKMIELAERISDGHPFLRVDFYEVKNKIFFGEITFYPAAGFGKFVPEYIDDKMGDLIDLNMVKKDEK